MSDSASHVSIKGRQRTVQSISLERNATLIRTGRFLTIGSIHDEFWLQASAMPEPEGIVRMLEHHSLKPDLFTFAQKLPDVTPRYSYHLEWESLAVAKFGSYAEWSEKLVNRSVRKHLKKATREGVTVEAVSFTDDLVTGICGIYNETRVRQGRTFWHYGKNFDVVKADNATYLDRSVFIGAYFGSELIGFLKMTVDGEVASIMQILSRASHFERRPTNALLAKAVEVCESMKVGYLTYGNYVYGNKEQSSLIDFKRNNGFARIDVPRYYVPLTVKGRLALRTGLHKGVKSLIPPIALGYALRVRAKVLGMMSARRGAVERGAS